MEIIHYKLLGLAAFLLSLRVLFTFVEVVPPRFRQVLCDYLDAGAVASVAAMFLVTFVFQVSRVEGDSMMPSLQDGHYALVNKLIYRLHPPQRGDVIVFRAPDEPNKDYIKRVIALPGETVEVRSGWVWINGLKLKEPYVMSRPDYSRPPELIKPRHVFVLGDNRQNSSDSHLWGQLSFDRIRGKSSFIIWPPSAIGFVPSYSKGNRWAS